MMENTRGVKVDLTKPWVIPCMQPLAKTGRALNCIPVLGRQASHVCGTGLREE